MPSDQPMPRPVETILPIPGLAEPFIILHITDLHACALTNKEIETMPVYRKAYALERRTAFTGGRAYPPAAVLPVLTAYAASISADLIVMTGDLLDFPSEGNLQLLETCMRESPVPCLFSLGNHDWCFADDYRTDTAAQTNLPRMDIIAGGDHRFGLMEFEHILVCQIDNDLEWLREDTVDAYMGYVRYARKIGKPLILTMHIPVTAETLAAEACPVWGRDLTLGVGATGGWNAQTIRFFREVAESSDYAPAAVIAGHIHFDHEDTLSNGTPQITTGCASDGHCRVIRLVPAAT